jgi:hypothetical protein
VTLIKNSLKNYIGGLLGVILIKELKVMYSEIDPILNVLINIGRPKMVRRGGV